VVAAIRARDGERARALTTWIWMWRHARFAELMEQRQAGSMPNA
jgi:hypothetical protein